MLAIGIDPGVTGAVALVGDRYAEVHDAPTHTPNDKTRINPAGVARLLKRALTLEEFTGETHNALAAIEYVSTRRGEAAARALGYGQGHGVYLGALAVLDLPPVIVTPAKWKKALGLDAKQNGKTDALMLARRLFPGFATMLDREKDHGRAEALLICHWLRGCFASRVTAAAANPMPSVAAKEF